jgi:hypothetical protein
MLLRGTVQRTCGASNRQSGDTMLPERLVLLPAVPFLAQLSTGAGLLPHCEYPTVVMPKPYELLLFGGSQENAVAMRGRHTRPRSDVLWRINLLSGEWRAANATGSAPLARSGHSAVMYDGKVFSSNFR